MLRVLMVSALMIGVMTPVVAAQPAERAQRIDKRLDRAERRGNIEQGSRADRVEDRFDRFEDRLDRREDRRDLAVNNGRRDRLEDRRDRAENVIDRRENRRDRRGNVGPNQ
ncbi:MAG: hypothetical protein AAGJ29_12550 [Pseudomonadota bacterium]